LFKIYIDLTTLHKMLISIKYLSDKLFFKTNIMVYDNKEEDRKERKKKRREGVVSFHHNIIQKKNNNLLKSN